LEKSLELDSNFNLAYSILGSVYMSLNNRELALKSFEKYLENGHPDTPDNINALYSMSLLLQQPKSDSKDAKEYYQKAKTAEARFKDLYGTHVGMNEIKRQAIQVHETPEEANRLILAGMPKKQYNEKIEQLIKAGILNTSYPASPDNCSHCGAGHLKDSPGKALLCCGGCKSSWYCSRDCQKSDYKNHKATCKKLQQK
jgi:tetratricopeptide (TPR) repeat protein